MALLSINQYYDQMVPTDTGVFIKTFEKTEEFVRLLNKKLGNNFISLRKFKNKKVKISCSDRRLKKVDHVKTNNKIDKIILKTHNFFRAMLEKKMWGVESAFIKAIRFSDFANIYYQNFKKDRIPKISSNNWEKYMIGNNFTSTVSVISYYDKYWTHFWTLSETKQWLVRLPKETTAIHLFKIEVKNWIEQSLIIYENIDNIFKARNVYQFNIDEFDIKVPVALFPCLINLKPIVAKAQEKYKLNSDHKLLFEFKLAQYLRRTITYLMILLSENYKNNEKDNENLNVFMNNIINICEKNINLYIKTILHDVVKIKKTLTRPYDYKIEAKILRFADDIYSKTGMEICNAFQNWEINDFYNRSENLEV